MNDYKLVLKTVLKNNFRGTDNYFSGKSVDAKKNTPIKLLNVFGVVVGFGAICGMMFFVTHILSLLVSVDKLSVEFLSTIFSVSQSMIVFFGFQQVLSNMFFAKDNEFLAQLPVKPQIIFAVKLTVIFLNELLISCLFLLPLLIAFISGSCVGGISVPWQFYVIMPIVFITTPIIPLAVVSIASFPFVKVAAYFKNRSIMTLVVSILSFVMLFAVYMVTIPNLDKLITIEGQASLVNSNMKLTIVAFGKGVFYNYLLASAMMSVKTALYLFLYILINIAALFLTIYLSSVLYAKSAAKIGENSVSDKKRDIAVSVQSLRKTLFMREFKTLFRDTNFAFNSILGSFMTPLIILLTSFLGSKEATAVVNANHVDTFAAQFMAAGTSMLYVFMMLCGMNYTSALAFSRDGNTFYTFRYLPVKVHDLVRAKINLANFVSLIGIVLTVFVNIVFLKLDFIFILLTAVETVLYVYLFNVLNVYRDLKRPNVNWVNSYEVIKRNFYPMVTMIISTISGFVFFLGSMFVTKLKIPHWAIMLIYWSVVYLIGACSLVAVSVRLKKNEEMLFNRIECKND